MATSADQDMNVVRPSTAPRLEKNIKNKKPFKFPFVSVIIVIHNNHNDLTICLPSLAQQSYESSEIIVVDSGSSDDGIKYVREKFPEIKVVDAGGNIGYGAANNIGVKFAKGELLAFLNPDTKVESDWLTALVQRMLHSPPDVGLITAKILLKSQPGRINTCGNNVHYTAIPACRGWFLPATEMNEIQEVNSISGAAFLIRRSVYDTLEGFDDDFFMYLEDNDLSWRAKLAGYRSIYAPQSIVYHEYTPRFHPTKFYYLERNRYRMLLKNFRWQTLLLLIPALLLTELVTWGYAILQGSKHMLAKIHAYQWIFRHWRTVMINRQGVQEKRVVGDAVLLKNSTPSLAYGLVQEGFAAKLAGLIFDPMFRFLHNFYSAVIYW